MAAPKQILPEPAMARGWQAMAAFLAIAGCCQGGRSGRLQPRAWQALAGSCHGLPWCCEVADVLACMSVL
jgi:hypothetical protein